MKRRWSRWRVARKFKPQRQFGPSCKPFGSYFKPLKACRWGLSPVTDTCQSGKCNQESFWSCIWTCSSIKPMRQEDYKTQYTSGLWNSPYQHHWRWEAFVKFGETAFWYFIRILHWKNQFLKTEREQTLLDLHLWILKNELDSSSSSGTFLELIFLQRSSYFLLKIHGFHFCCFYIIDKL